MRFAAWSFAWGALITGGFARAAPLELEAGPAVHGAQTELSTECVVGSAVYFFVGTQGTGAGPCLAALGGTCSDLLGPKFLGGRDCTNGTASRSWSVPAGVPSGADLTFQVLSWDGVVGAASEPVLRYVDAWSATPAIDGNAGDWSVLDEGFDTTSAVGTTYVTWDDDFLYVASTHPDVQLGGPLHWFTVYVGEGLGTSTGVQFGSQEPALPVPFTHQLRWKADNSYNSLMTFDGVSWISTDGWLGTEGSAMAENDALQTVEFSIPWTALALGGPKFAVHTAWLYEGAGFESTYAGSPDTSFADGYDPDFQEVLVFDRSRAVSPVAQN